MSDPISSVREGYNRWATVYEQDGNPLIAMEEPIVRNVVGDPSGLHVLDLGCGTGRHALWLSAAGAHVTAIDFSEGMLAEARKKPGADRVKFLSHDLHNPLPFPTATFDLVVSGLVLEHLRDLPPFFSEARRVLKPTGRAIISAMHPAMFLRGAQARFTDPTTGQIVQPGSIAHSISDFVTSAVRANFQIADLIEKAPDAPLAAAFPRAEKYIDWPMLVVLSLATTPQ